MGQRIKPGDFSGWEERVPDNGNGVLLDEMLKDHGSGDPCWPLGG